MSCQRSSEKNDIQPWQYAIYPPFPRGVRHRLGSRWPVGEALPGGPDLAVVLRSTARREHRHDSDAAPGGPLGQKKSNTVPNIRHLVRGLTIECRAVRIPESLESHGCAHPGTSDFVRFPPSFAIAQDFSNHGR